MVSLEEPQLGLVKEFGLQPLHHLHFVSSFMILTTTNQPAVVIFLTGLLLR